MSFSRAKRFQRGWIYYPETESYSRIKSEMPLRKDKSKIGEQLRSKSCNHFSNREVKSKIVNTMDDDKRKGFKDELHEIKSMCKTLQNTLSLENKFLYNEFDRDKDIINYTAFKSIGVQEHTSRKNANDDSVFYALSRNLSDLQKKIDKLTGLEKKCHKIEEKIDLLLMGRSSRTPQKVLQFRHDVDYRILSEELFLELLEVKKQNMALKKVLQKERSIVVKS